VNPTYDTDTDLSHSSTKDCLKDAGFEENEDISATLKPTRGDALGISTDTGLAGVVFLGSEQEAKQARRELRDIAREAVADGSASANAAAGLDKNLEQKGSLVVFFRPEVSEASRARVKNCAWEIATNRWSDWIGIEMKQLDKPFEPSHGR
jgi:hypothetical protein